MHLPTHGSLLRCQVAEHLYRHICACTLECPCAVILTVCTREYRNKYPSDALLYGGIHRPYPCNRYRRSSESGSDHPFLPAVPPSVRPSDCHRDPAPPPIVGSPDSVLNTRSKVPFHAASASSIGSAVSRYRNVPSSAVCPITV